MSLNDTLFLSMLRQEAAQRQAEQDRAGRMDMAMLKDQRDQQLADKIGIASRQAAMAPTEPGAGDVGGDQRVLPHAKVAFQEAEQGRAADAEGYRRKREMLGDTLKSRDYATDVRSQTEASRQQSLSSREAARGEVQREIAMINGEYGLLKVDRQGRFRVDTAKIMSAGPNAAMATLAKVRAIQAGLKPKSLSVEQQIMYPDQAQAHALYQDELSGELEDLAEELEAAIGMMGGGRGGPALAPPVSSGQRTSVSGGFRAPSGGR